MTAPDPSPGGGLAARFKGRRGIVLAVVVAGGGYVAWRWWQARSAPAGPPVTGDVGAPVDASGIIGAPGGGGNVQYAGTTQDNTDQNKINTNEQWSAVAVERLSATGGFNAASVYTALGDFLARRPLTQAEQNIVRAAIAAAGQPPVGGPYSIIEQVGPVTLTAPTGLKAAAVGKTSVDLTFSPVTGAAFYYLYRGGVKDNVSGSRDTKMTASGLKPGTSYSFQVAAAATTGKLGPKSAPLKITTKK